MNTVAKKKIAVADFNGKSILSDAFKDSAHIVLGVVGGIAVAIAKSETADGGTIEGLRGAFRFVPNVKDADILTAPVLWLPAGTDAGIKAKLTATENPAPEVRFLYEVTATKSDDGKSFTLGVNTILDVVPEASAVDPVVQLFAEHMPEAPATEAGEATPAPSVEGDAVSAAPAKAPAKK